MKRDIESDAAWMAAREAEETAWQAYRASGRSAELGRAYDAAVKVTDAAKDVYMEGK